MSEPSSLTPLLSTGSGSSSRMFSPSQLWRIGILFVAAGMTADAFGTHALKKMAGLSSDKVESFMAAGHYAIFNGLGLCIVSLHPHFRAHRFAGPAIAVGGFIFSATIMTVVLGRGRLSWLAPVIPCGGTLMIAGYAADSNVKMDF